MRHPFVPRVLVHLVGLHHRIIQRQRIGGLTSLLLKLMTPLEQVRTVPPQFAGELGGGHPFSDAPEEQDQLRGVIGGLMKDGVGEGVEDATHAAQR